MADIKINLDLIYPVGSIYMNVNQVDPGEIFGGTWQRIQGRFLLCATGDNGGATGGESEHKLTAAELPAHEHKLFWGTEYVVVNDNNKGTGATNWDQLKLKHLGSGETYAGGFYARSYQTGSAIGQAHNNLPPYLTVYTWKRIA